MEKIDFKKTQKELYRPGAKKATLVKVPPLQFLMIDGKGDPNTAQTFGEAIEVLYKLSYTLKFMVKKGALGIDYGVLPLEGLWWAEDMRAFTIGSKDDWLWTLMIRQPDFINAGMTERAKEDVLQKKQLDKVRDVRFETYAEGLSAQIMHIGPFSEEGPTIDKLHQFIDDCGKSRRGKHHEIYLSDTRRAAPEKWKTIIRQPVD
jgi:hypothetical protein